MLPYESPPPEEYHNPIGTRHESSLHRDLKIHFAGAEGMTEVNPGYKEKYIFDGLSKTGELIEVQIGSFGLLRDKVAHIAPLKPIRIIHPIIMQKHIEVYDTENIWCYSRKSPRRGTIWDLFKVLVYAPEIPLIPGITIELALVTIKQQRRNDGLGSWRRKGVSILDTQLVAIQNSLVLSGKHDYRVFLPPLQEPFTAKDLGMHATISPSLARKTLYVLTTLGIVKGFGKKGRTLLYTRTE